MNVNTTGEVKMSASWPQLNTRVEPVMRERIRALAVLRGTTISALITSWALDDLARVTGKTTATES